MKVTIVEMPKLSEELKTELSAYRYKIFIQRLGWQLSTDGKNEVDQFDTENTTYVVARSENGNIVGCARLLPTTEPYLLQQVFPHLLSGVAPCSPEVWEISRFCAIDVNHAKASKPLEVSREILACAMTYIRALGASAAVTVSPVGIGRLLYRLGINPQCIGPQSSAQGQSIRAFWIDANDASHLLPTDYGDKKEQSLLTGTC